MGLWNFLRDVFTVVTGGELQPAGGTLARQAMDHHLREQFEWSAQHARETHERMHEEHRRMHGQIQQEHDQMHREQDRFHHYDPHTGW